MAGKASIYGLYDKQGNLRYIGKANNPAERLKSHMRDSRRRRTPVYDWIRKHGKPEMRILATDSGDWRVDERRLIADARARGEKLLNLADGGDEPFCSSDQRKANGQKMQSHPNTIEQRKANGRNLADRVAGDPSLAVKRETKRALSAAIRQGYLSNEKRAKLRDMAKANPYFKSFAKIPDRIEDEKGRAFVKVGKIHVQVG